MSSQYLGELDSESRAAVEEEETTPTIPLLCIPGRVLFPEETLPMHIYNPHVSPHPGRFADGGGGA